MASEAIAYVDGGVVPLEQARVVLVDRGHLLGDGVFETMRVRDGVVLHRDRHEARLRRGLALLHAEDALEETQRAIGMLVGARGRSASDWYLRLQVTTGTSDEFAGAEGEASVTAILRPLRAYPRRAYEEGITLTFAPYPKPYGPWASVKVTSFLAHVEARRHARAKGFDDALFLNSKGNVCEATTSNVFAVVDAAIHAPGASEDAVDGIQRSILVEEYARRGVPVTETLTMPQLSRAEEVWLTNTIAGALPVRSLDGRRLTGPGGARYAEASRTLERARAGAVAMATNPSG